MRILVPRLFDAANINAQNLNAKALLSRFTRENCLWLCPHIGTPDAAVAKNRRVKLVKLLPRRPWIWHLTLLYQYNVDAIFYPGVEAHDAFALSFRDRTGRHVPTISTLEGVAGDQRREASLSELVGHQVYCQHVTPRRLERATTVLHAADHIIAISPLLAKVGTHSYGDKCSVLPLGVDTSLFRRTGEGRVGRPRVVCAGNVRAHKRPEVFLSLARRFPQADFAWFGEGDLRDPLSQEIRALGLHNVSFPGPRLPAELAEEFANSDILVLPSLSEGVPKVTQEAAAAGLAQVVFGFYESPTVINGRNGFVVWNDDELQARLDELIGDGPLRRRMGQAGTEMAAEWSWDEVAPRWEERVIGYVKASKTLSRARSSAANSSTIA